MTGTGLEERTFRDRALEGSGNPLEQLDRLFRLTARRTWAAVLALTLLVGALLLWGVVATRDVTVKAPGMLVPRNGFVEVARLESGVVDQVNVRTGDRVRTGDVLATFVAPGGIPQEIVSPVDGKVVEVSITGGSTLVPGLPALVIQPAPTDVMAIALAPPNVHAQIAVGQEVALAAASAPPAQYGSIVGHITRISDTPATLSRLDRLTGGNQDLARALLAAGPVYEVDIRLARDPDTTSGLEWTTDEGPDYQVPAGTLVQMVATVRRESIASGLFR